MKKGQVRYGRGYSPRQRSRRDREKKPISWKSKLIVAWILFLILALSYLLFFSPVFEIKEIKVSGNQAIDSENIQSSLDDFLYKKTLIFFDRNNIFLATSNKLRETLIKDFPRILFIEVNKSIFKKTIDLEITERKGAGIFCKNECYYIDKYGVIFEEAPQTSGTLILLIKDHSERDIEMGMEVIEKEFMAELIELRARLFDKFNLRVLEFIVETIPYKDLKVNIHEGWYILFDKSRDLKNQLQALELVLAEKIEERENLEYIDLRIENRVYYK